MRTPRNSETLMLQDVWRQALIRGELPIEFQTEAGAVRARMQLYNAVKKQKSGEDMEDMELVHAAEQIEIVWVQKGPKVWVIRLQRKDRSDMMNGLSKALGKSVHEYVDPDIVESGQRLLRELEKESKAADAPAVPFYGRRGE